MASGCANSFPCTIRKAARDYHHAGDVPSNLKCKRLPARTPISTSWEELRYSRKHFRTHLSPSKACALLQRGCGPRADGKMYLVHGCHGLFFFVPFHLDLLLSQSSHKHHAGQLGRRGSLDEPKLTHFVGKAGTFPVLCFARSAFTCRNTES